MAVKLQPQDDSEARTQGTREQAGTGGGSDEGEGLNVHGVGAGGWTLANHDVQFVIFESGVKNFFKRGLQAVDFVDEEHLAVAQIGENCCELTFNLQRWPGGLLKSGAEFIGIMVASVVFPRPGGPY